MENQKPTVGRIVHYKNSDGSVLAAIIVQVHSDELVNLNVFYAGGGSTFAATSCMRGGDVGKWDWPQRDA